MTSKRSNSEVVSWAAAVEYVGHLLDVKGGDGNEASLHSVARDEDESEERREEESRGRGRGRGSDGVGPKKYTLYNLFSKVPVSRLMISSADDE